MAGVLSGAVFCRAQQADVSADPAQKNDVGKGAKDADVFSGLPRLRVPVTLAQSRVTIDDLLRGLSDSMGVPLHTDGIQGTRVAVRWQHLPLRDALDGLAHIGEWEWVRDTNRELTLRARYNPHRNDMSRPRTQAQADEQQAGREFLKQFADLPADMQRDLQAHHADGARGIPFSRLPEGVKQTLRDGYAAHQQHDMELMHRPPRLSLAEVEQSSLFVALDHNTRADSVMISFDYQGAGRNAGEALQGKVFNDLREQHYEMVSRKPGENVGMTHPERDDANLRLDALQSDPRMKLKISLSGGSKLTLYEALKTLAAQVQEQAPGKPLPFVTDSRDRSDTRRAPDLRDVPLGGRAR